MNEPDHDSANRPLDEVDRAIMSGLRAMWERVDPMPAGLVDQFVFVLELHDVDAEMCHLAERHTLVGTRGEEHSALVIFDSDSLTIMVKIDKRDDGRVRLDGWLNPPASHRIELRSLTGSMFTTSDDAGRFALQDVSAGTAQLVVHPRTTSDGPIGGAVTTPAILL